MAGFLDQRPQSPRISQEIVHPLSQPLPIFVVIHDPHLREPPTPPRLVYLQSIIGTT